MFDRKLLDILYEQGSGRMRKFTQMSVREFPDLCLITGVPFFLTVLPIQPS